MEICTVGPLVVTAVGVAGKVPFQLQEGLRVKAGWGGLKSLDSGGK